MTRFEKASQDQLEMSIMVAFCIAAYLEQSEICFMTDNALKDFLKTTSEDIYKWLGEESDN